MVTGKEAIQATQLLQLAKFSTALNIVGTLIFIIGLLTQRLETDVSLNQVGAYITITVKVVE